MTIDISTIKSYDPAAYTAAQEAYIQSTGKTAQDFENRVMSLAENPMLNAGDILTLVNKELPALSNPVTQSVQVNYSMLPSLGAMANAAITDTANDQRKMASDARIEANKAIVAKIDEEVKAMKVKAYTQLIMGIVSGSLQIGSGLYQAGAAGSALKSNMDTNQLGATNIIIQGKAGAIGGVGKLIDSGSQFAGTIIDAQITDLHKDQEQLRQMRDRMESLDASLKELIQKGNQTSEAIVQSSREMRNRLLA
jgi:hypothetical protein